MVNLSSLVALFLLYVNICARPCYAEGFNFFTELIVNPLGSLSERLFKFNPFRDTFDPIKALVSNFEEFDPNSTLTKRNYDYGCNCRNFTCSCCGHVEAAVLQLNKTGIFCVKYEILI